MLVNIVFFGWLPWWKGWRTLDSEHQAEAREILLQFAKNVGKIEAHDCPPQI